MVPDRLQKVDFFFLLVDPAKEPLLKFSSLQEIIVTSLNLGLAIKTSMIDFRSFTVRSFITNMFDLYRNKLSLQIVLKLLDTVAH